MLFAAVLCSVLQSSMQDASPAPAADPEAAPSADAHQFRGAPPNFGFRNPPRGGKEISAAKVIQLYGDNEHSGCTAIFF